MGDSGYRLALRAHEAAKALGISTRKLRELTMPRGPIPCVRIGNGTRPMLLYPLASLQGWLEEQEVLSLHNEKSKT